jgi:hypothetical protein
MPPAAWRAWFMMSSALGIAAGAGAGKSSGADGASVTATGDTGTAEEVLRSGTGVAVGRAGCASERAGGDGAAGGFSATFSFTNQNTMLRPSGWCSGVGLLK